MPCHAAMIEKPLTFSPDIEVEKALKEMKKKKVNFAVVLDEEGKVAGLLSLKGLMNNLLPVNVAVSDGLVLDIPVKAAPGIAKRLRKIYPLKVGELMERKALTCVFPETPIWECVNRILSHGGPIIVVDEGAGKFLGMITERSIFEELQRLQESEG